MSNSVWPHRRQPTRSPVPGILQARTLEWVAISFSNAWKWKVKVKSLSHARLLATPWTTAYQAPPSMGFSRQEYWSGVPLPSPLLSLSLYIYIFIFIMIATKCIHLQEKKQKTSKSSIVVLFTTLPGPQLPTKWADRIGLQKTRLLLIQNTARHFFFFSLHMFVLRQIPPPSVDF